MKPQLLKDSERTIRKLSSINDEIKSPQQQQQLNDLNMNRKKKETNSLGSNKRLLSTSIENYCYSAITNNNNNNNIKMSQTRKKSLERKYKLVDVDNNFTQTMYNITTLQFNSNRRYASSSSARRNYSISQNNSSTQSQLKLKSSLLLPSPLLTTATPTTTSARLTTRTTPTSLHRNNNNNDNRQFATSFAFIATIVFTIIFLYLPSNLIVLQTQALSASASTALNNNAGGSSDPSSPTSSSSSAAAAAAAATSSIAGSLLSSLVESNNNKQSKERSDQLTSTTGSSSQSQTPTSVVASLSAAVVSAAAAAAKAAALSQNGLSGSDGRSLLSSNNHGANNHRHSTNNHQARSPGLNLALKIADSIPEVPYNILHNMKKIDHAAPFYNVGLNNKIGPGSSRDLTHNLLTNALQASASGGGGGGYGPFNAENLSSLFRSPIWKRIADGYGEFTSEFRSLFRAPATPMKGPLSPTSKLLRDISVPALLMLAASVIPSDWHPIKTRRKSLLQSDGNNNNNNNQFQQQQHLSSLISPADPMSISASNIEFPNYSAMPAAQQFNRPQMENFLNLSPQARGGLASSSGSGSSSNLMQFNPSSFDQSAAQVVGARAISPSGDFNLQIQPAALDNSWLQQQQQQTLTGQNQPSSIGTAAAAAAAAVEQQQQPNMSQQPTSQLLQQQQQPTRRLGEIANFQQDLMPKKPVKINSDSLQVATTSSDSSGSALINNNNNNNNLSTKFSNAGLFSSLTSNLANEQSKLLNRILNSNSVSGILSPAASSFKMISLPLESHLNSRKLLESRQDQLSDKHKYSLVGLTDNDLSNFNGGGFSSLNNNEQNNNNNNYQKLSTKPFLLSSITQALKTIFNPQNNQQLNNDNNHKRESGSPSPSSSSFSNFLNNNHKSSSSSSSYFSLFGGDKTINSKETLSRRQQQQTTTNAGAVEQRDLTQFLPQTWQDLAKRTMSNVKQQASSQWKSIEGQLTNWVQDKLKTIPAAQPTAGGAASVSASASSSGSNVQQAAPATPVANLIASVSSTAMNILGLNNNNNNNNNKNSPSSSPSSTSSLLNSQDSSSLNNNDSNQKSKTDSSSPNRSSSTTQSGGTQSSGVGTALAGVANMIVSSLTSRSSASNLPSSQTKPSIPTTNLASAAASSISNNDSSGSVPSQYPTLTAATSSVSSSSSSSSPSSPVVAGTVNTETVASKMA